MTEAQLDYQEFLKSPFWISLSKSVRDGACCVLCGSKNRLQAHHKFYRKDWYKTQRSDLVVLCNKCHEKEHGIRTGKPAKQFRRKKQRKHRLTRKERRMLRDRLPGNTHWIIFPTR